MAETSDKHFGRRECDTCSVHETVSDKLNDVTEKLENIVTEIVDLRWVKSIGRFLIGIMITFMLTAFPLTWKLFDKTTDLMIRVDSNTTISRENHEQIENLALDVKEELKEIKKAVEKTNELILRHILDSQKHPYNKLNGLPSGLKLDDG